MVVVDEILVVDYIESMVVVVPQKISFLFSIKIDSRYFLMLIRVSNTQDYSRIDQMNPPPK